MEAEIVTFSCDASPMYHEFWNPVSRYWKTRFALQPVLLYCGDEDISFSEEYGVVHRVPSVEGIPSYLSATWGRFWITRLYPNQTCLTGDIDMVPLSAAFFDARLASYDDDIYVHLNADAYCSGDFEFWKRPFNTLIAHDHLAKGAIFQRVYSFEDTFEAEMRKYAAIDYSTVKRDCIEGIGYATQSEEHLRHASADSGGKWCHDELYSTDKLRQYAKSGGRIRCDLSIPRNRRLDRSRWIFTPRDVTEGWYLDSHLLRPYSRYKEEIDFLLNLVPQKLFS